MLVYMDDVIIHANSLREHDKRVRNISIDSLQLD